MKVTIVAGARPNYMKIAPIMRAIESAQDKGIDITCRLIYSGKEEDPTIEPTLYRDLQIRKPDCFLNADSANNITLTSEIMLAFDKELDENPTDIVLVVDDLTATMSCAIVAKKRGLKVAHLVAGTRSFDLSMPKEVNRLITDGLSDYLFTAGVSEIRNLMVTGQNADNVYNVGNILIDTIRFNHSRLAPPEWMDRLNIQNNRYFMLTLNRRKLLSQPALLRELLLKLSEKAGAQPVIAPVHEHVKGIIEKLHLNLPNLRLLPTQDYLSFIYLLQNAKAIITDSGNVSEESTFLGTPCITLNSYAEHPETCRQGTNELVGEDPDALGKALDTVNAGQWKKGTIPEHWDGYSGDRIVKILLREYH